MNDEQSKERRQLTPEQKVKIVKEAPASHWYPASN
jgi:hypothetical protein